MARIKQHYYASERIYFNKKLKHLVKEETEYLIADGRYMTKLTPADLPDWFVHGYYYRRDGYMSAKGVVSMVYHPNLWINHFLKDDFLYISYKDMITVPEVPEHPWEKYTGYDYLITGGEILTFLRAAREYSGYDIKPIIEQVRNKLSVLREKHPGYFNNWDFDVDEYFSKPFIPEKR